MKLPGYLVNTILLVLFFFAANTRSVSLDVTPYFAHETSTNYQIARGVADGRSLSNKDLSANWPGGFRPARDRAVGVEATTGVIIRIARYLGETTDRRVARRVIAGVGGLCVIVVYLLVSSWWRCQAAGLLAALLAAFWLPLVEATSSRTFTHGPFATLGLLLLALAWQRALEARRGATAAVALVAFALIGAWNTGLAAMAVAAAISTVVPGVPRQRRVQLVIAQTGAVVVAALVFPWLHATGAWGSWPLALALAAVLTVAVEGRIRPRSRLVAVGGLVVVAVVLTGAGALLRSHPGDAGFPLLQYAVLRLRFLTGKPAALALPDTIRYAWSAVHAPLPLRSALSLLVPLVVLLPTAVGTSAQIPRARRIAAAVIAFVGLVISILDRSALAPAAFAVVPLAVVGAVGFSGAPLWRKGLLLGGVGIVLVESFAPASAIDIPYQFARTAGRKAADTAHFSVLSTEDTDRELVRFIARNTSTSDAFLGPPEISSIISTFTGRPITALPGSPRQSVARRAVHDARLWYSSVSDLRNACRQMKVRYVIYSADIFLDDGRYSPRYLAAVSPPDTGTAAWQLQFAPESINGFTLVYENDRYRLYRFAETRGPMFVTDHPPIFQLRLFASVHGNVRVFHTRVTGAMLMYWRGTNAIGRGDFENAIDNLNRSLRFAPHFTRARVARASARIQLGEFVAARRELRAVLASAPDNAEALYQAAWVNAALGDKPRAVGLLKVLFTTPADRDVIDRARLLRTLIERGVPITPDVRAPKPKPSARGTAPDIDSSASGTGTGKLDSSGAGINRIRR